jgi:hypothetical protein
MSDLKGAVPFAFALALSAASPNAGIPAFGKTSELLEPGSLRNLIDRNEAFVGDKSSGAAGDGGLTRRMAQYGCWYGYWRRC